MKQFDFILPLFIFLVAGCTEAPYRLPYEDGTQVLITQDDQTHTTPAAAMFDMRAEFANEPLVAAKAGFIRFVKETGNSSASTNNFVWIEHPLDYCQPSGSVPPGGQQGCRTCRRGLGACNEWTLYAHMQQGSVTAKGLSSDDWVEAGQEIAVEGDVGMTDCGSNAGDPGCGRHVHFNVFRPVPGFLNIAPDGNGTYEAYAAAHGRIERKPLFCTAGGLRRVRQGQTYEAAPC